MQQFNSQGADCSTSIRFVAWSQTRLTRHYLLLAAIPKCPTSGVTKRHCALSCLYSAIRAIRYGGAAECDFLFIVQGHATTRCTCVISFCRCTIRPGRIYESARPRNGKEREKKKSQAEMIGRRRSEHGALVRECFSGDDGNVQKYTPSTIFQTRSLRHDDKVNNRIRDFEVRGC